MYNYKLTWQVPRLFVVFVKFDISLRLKLKLKSTVQNLKIRSRLRDLAYVFRLFSKLQYSKAELQLTGPFVGKIDFHHDHMAG